MSSARCSNCSLINFATATACKRCGLPFDFTAGSEWDSRPHAHSEAEAQFPEGESPYWDQPSCRPDYAPPNAPPSSLAPKIVKIFVGLAVVFLVAFLAIPALLRLKKSDLSNLSWNDYHSPDGKFSVSLPLVPKETTMSQPTALGTVRVHVLQADVSKDGGCMLMYADYPIERLNMSEETLYDLALQRAVQQQKILEITTRRYITLDGHRGLEVELKPTDPKLMMSASARVFWVTPRLYLVLGGGPDTPEYKAVQKRCLDSFKLLKR